MKIFKKLVAFALAIVAMLSLTACKQQSLDTDGKYWFLDATSFPLNFEETLTYTVNVTENTPYNSSVVKNENVKLNVISGVYTTTLKTLATTPRRYEYTTTLNISGEYVAEGVEPKPFNDVMQSVAVFNEDYTPVSSSKTASNSSILSLDENGNYVIVNYSFKYQTTYEKKVAKSTFIEYNPTSGEQINSTSYEYTDYSNGAFVDNEALLLFPRLYNVDKDFVTRFKTIDVLSQKNHETVYYAVNNGEAVDVKNFPCYALNGKVSNELVPCNHLSVYIDDTFQGYPLEVYYAVDHQTHRHRMLKGYTKLNDNLGYLEFTLSSATTTH